MSEIVSLTVKFPDPIIASVNLGTVVQVQGTSAVQSVAGKSGIVILNKGDVGLGNVDNTPDADKSVDTANFAAQAANADLATLATSAHQIGDEDPSFGHITADNGGGLAIGGFNNVVFEEGQADLFKSALALDHVANTSDADKPVSNAQAAALAAKAPINSPALTGAPTAPTPTTGDSSTKISTTAFVAAAIAALINSAPGALDTLKELAGALGDDPNFATTITNALAGKVDKSGSLSQLATRLFSDLQSKPTTLSGYGITDAASSSGLATKAAINGSMLYDSNGTPRLVLDAAARKLYGPVAGYVMFDFSTGDDLIFNNGDIGIGASAIIFRTAAGYIQDSARKNVIDVAKRHLTAVGAIGEAVPMLDWHDPEELVVGGTDPFTGSFSSPPMAIPSGIKDAPGGNSVAYNLPDDGHGGSQGWRWQSSDGNTYFDNAGFRSNPIEFASVSASPVEGMIQAFTDSTTDTWGDTISGGGSSHVLGYFNGTDWTVLGK